MESSSKLSVFKLPLLFSLVLCLGMFLGYKMSRQIPYKSNNTNSAAYLNELIDLIETHYVDSIDKETLYQNGIEGILKQLDPHTVFIPKEDLVRSNEELEGAFYGIGIEFFIHQDSVVVAAILPDGPSAKTNLNAGDRIIKIEDSIIAGRPLSDQDVIKQIRGQRESKIKLTVLHLDGKLETVEVARDMIAYNSVKASFKLQDSIGYIALQIFNETTSDEFKTALKELKKEGITKLIIDVRDNPGGYMTAATDIIDEVIPGKKKIVSTKGRFDQEEYFTNNDGLFETEPIVILVNEFSASASEILAGSIQDLNRGKIIGRRTFGKGLVQEQFSLPDNSAIRITTARYYLPSGRCIQKSYSEGKEEYYHDIDKRYKDGMLNAEDTSHSIASRKKYFTENKTVVYGDEGVNPDVFIPLDTSQAKLMNSLYEEHIIERIAEQYVFLHASELKTIANKTDLVNKLFNIKEYANSISTLISNMGFNHFFMQNPILSKKINALVNAEIAKILFGKEAKIYVENIDDTYIQKAIQELNHTLK